MMLYKDAYPGLVVKRFEEKYCSMIVSLDYHSRIHVVDVTFFNFDSGELESTFYNGNAICNVVGHV